MPDFAANQPAMLARLPLRAGLDWPVSRCASAKNTLDTHPWHHRLLLVEGRAALSVPVRPPTCRAITTEKREAHTAGPSAEASPAREKRFFLPSFPPLSTSRVRMYRLLTDTAPGYLLLTSSQSPHRRALFVRNTLSARHHTCDRPFSCTCRRCESSLTSVALSRPAIHNLL